MLSNTYFIGFPASHFKTNQNLLNNNNNNNNKNNNNNNKNDNNKW